MEERETLMLDPFDPVGESFPSEGGDMVMGGEPPFVRTVAMVVHWPGWASDERTWSLPQEKQKR